MSIMRSALLAGSESRWLRERASRTPFVRRAVRRFMPGEELADALAAADALRARGITAVVTKLGEGITDPGEAAAVFRHYDDVLREVARRQIDCQISVKPTQLGLDIDPAQCHGHVRALVERAHETGNYVWVDMEQFGYVDPTLELYRRVRAEFPNVGVCLQSYLYRTPKDVEALLAIGAGIRLVKGAYREPASVAFPKKADVDAAYHELAKEMIGPAARGAGVVAVFGTHDPVLIRAIQAHADGAGVARRDYEYDLLYGIQRGEQERLAANGSRIRVLIAYGSYWFPWYMRRLAERPANVWFVVKSAFT
jgi:proline dehydrogenase